MIVLIVKEDRLAKGNVKWNRITEALDEHDSKSFCLVLCLVLQCYYCAESQVLYLSQSTFSWGLRMCFVKWPSSVLSRFCIQLIPVHPCSYRINICMLATEVHEPACKQNPVLGLDRAILCGQGRLLVWLSRYVVMLVCPTILCQR